MKRLLLAFSFGLTLLNTPARGGLIDFGPTQLTEGYPFYRQVTFPVSVVTDELTSIASIRIIFESDDMDMAPPAGGPALPTVHAMGDVSLRSGFRPDGQIGFVGVPGDFAPEGFLGNFSVAFIDLNGTAPLRGINFEAVNLEMNAGRPILEVTPGEVVYLGQLTVDLSTSSEYEWEVEVAGGSSVIANFEGSEELSGVGRVIVPEPATVLLFGVGVVACRRTRRPAGPPQRS